MVKGMWREELNTDLSVVRAECEEEGICVYYMFEESET